MAQSGFNTTMGAVTAAVVDSCVGAADAQEGTCYDPNGAKVLSIVSIFVITAASAIGVFLPLFGKKCLKGCQPGSFSFIVGKCFSAGIVLALAFTHVLYDAVDKLQNPCLTGTWQKFPWAFFIAALGVAGSLLLELLTVSFHELFTGNDSLSIIAKEHHHEVTQSRERPVAVVGVEPVEGGHVAADENGWTDNEKAAAKALRRKRVIAEVLEIGIVTHSVLVGLGQGTSTNKCTVTTLLVALIFHQMFEGIALGSCIVEAAYSLTTTLLFGALFAITTPIGIGLGLAIRSSYSETSTTSLITEGIFNSATAGILVYMATVDLIAHDFFSETMLQNRRTLWCSYVALLLGMGVMSVIAYWA